MWKGARGTPLWCRASLVRQRRQLMCASCTPPFPPSPPLPTTPCRDRARAPTVLLLNSDDPAALRHSLPALADLPTAAMPLAASPSGLPALGWQMPAARAAVQQLLAAGEWLRARVAAAQYAHLPLASIGGDWILDAADALYARQLRECGWRLLCSWVLWEVAGWCVRKIEQQLTKICSQNAWVCFLPHQTHPHHRWRCRRGGAPAVGRRPLAAGPGHQAGR